MEETQQPQARPEAREVRSRRRKKSYRTPFLLIGACVAAAVGLQSAGIVDLGLPIPAVSSSSQGSGSGFSVPDAQMDLRDLMSNAASAVRQGPGERGARGERGPAYQPPPGQGPETSASLPGVAGGSQDIAGPTDADSTGFLGEAGRDDLAAALPAGSGPAVTRRADGHRSEVERAWFTAGGDLARRAHHARARALQLGARNYEAASRALLAPQAPGEPLERARLAARLSPDLPMARVELGRALLREGEYVEAVQEFVEGVRAIPRNLEATLWLAASLLAMFAAVLTLGSLAFIVWAGLSVFRYAAHDVGDLVSKSMPEFARAALLASILLVPILIGEAFMGIVLGLFLLGFTYSEAGCRRALALAAVLLLIGLYPITQLAGVALTTLDSDPVAASAHAVLRSMSSPGDIAMLEESAANDVLAEAALALRERRAGDPIAAKARYEALVEKTPADPVALSVLSNMYFERGDNERAIALGERAAALTRSATLLFNLSQVYARSFRMDEFEGAMAQAQAVDAVVVADLSKAKAPDFVADLAFPEAAIRDRMLASAGGDRFVDPVARVLMPGRIGQSWMNTAGAFAAAAVLGLLLGGRWDHASHCGRCGRRICSRCDGTVWNNQICDGCHHLFHRPETTDPTLRMTRLAELRRRESRIERIATIASVLVPGVGGLLARRPDLSFLGLFLFAWAVILFLWRDGIVVDPLAVGAVGPLVFVLAAGLVSLFYAGVVFLGLVIRRNL